MNNNTPPISLKERAHVARRVTWIGIAWNVVLITIKFLAGIFGKSSALIADAFHSVSDFGTDIAVLLSVRLANRPVDETHHYGHGKIETLASIVISLFLFFVAVGIMIDSGVQIYHFMHGKPLERPGLIALMAAILSIIIKEGLYRYTLKHGKRIKSNALIANAWHHRSDALTSVAVSLGIAGANLLGRHFVILDPIAAFLVALFILNFVRSSFKESINELLEASLGQEENQKILDVVRQTPGVFYPHQLRTRRIGNTIAIEITIKVDPTLSIVQAHDIATKVENRLREEFGKDIFVSTHIEPYFRSQHLK